ncbi:tyrosine-type recombinase/integrase [Oceanobacillus massiliensis]|uniref:tyrosine-type recombinase/integrase n=1 Tax=Oceanobacillus massiliensis TaxID=1465765 RepID=UPI0002898B40|nr:site-specific integrase [Oceanobacillus massiliensis]
MTKNNLVFETFPLYNKQSLEELLKNRINQLGDFSFEDDKWYYSKKNDNPLRKEDFIVNFYQVPIQYKNELKYYALLSTGLPRVIRTKCNKISQFLKFIDKTYLGLPIAEITRSHVNAYEYQLRLKNSATYVKQGYYAAIQDFFMKLTDFDDTPNTVPTKNINPFRYIKEKSKRKPIPKKVIRSWDRIMKDQDISIPLEFRTFYWLIRSFPNRISELLSMRRDCLKSFYSEYLIQIPTTKQSGGYIQEEIKTIPVAYSGHGKYVINLIQQLQEQTEELLLKNNIEEDIRTDFLFIVQQWGFKNNGEKPSVRYYDQIFHLKKHKINALFKQLAEILDFRDDLNQLIIPTSHQFRHNAVTDRAYAVGYTLEQIRRLTGHKNEVMPKHYTHQLIEKHKEIHLGIENLRSSNDSPVEFRGKIMNLDERTTKQLSREPRRYLTWEANGKKGVGICSDITGCNPKGTSVHFECYACDWFVPKLEYLKDYKAEYEYWMDVVDRTSGDTKRAAHFENAIRNVSYLERILKICENGIEHFKEEKLQEQLDKFNTPPVWE